MASDRQDDTAYRGYLIKWTSTGWAIEKDGHFIAWANSLGDARKTIDLIA